MQGEMISTVLELGDGMLSIPEVDFAAERVFRMFIDHMCEKGYHHPISCPDCGCSNCRSFVVSSIHDLTDEGKNYMRSVAILLEIIK